MLGGSYNPMATNVVEMLVREFEWDYVAVRTQFVTGILAFILAQALRVYKTLHQREFLARSVMLFLLFCACQVCQQLLLQIVESVCALPVLAP